MLNNSSWSSFLSEKTKLFPTYVLILLPMLAMVIFIIPYHSEGLCQNHREDSHACPHSLFPKLLNSYFLSFCYQILFSSFFFFFVVRNIVPELTSVPVFLYFVCGAPPQHSMMSSVQIRAWDPNPRTPGHQRTKGKLHHQATKPVSQIFNL